IGRLRVLLPGPGVGHAPARIADTHADGDDVTAVNSRGSALVGSAAATRWAAHRSGGRGARGACMDQRRPLDDQGESRREITELVVVQKPRAGVVHVRRRLTRIATRPTRTGKARHDAGPVLRLADQVHDGLDQDTLLGAALEAELSAEVAELSE